MALEPETSPSSGRRVAPGRIRELIAEIGTGAYAEGSSTKPGWLYHPLPFPGFDDVPVHKMAAVDECGVILDDIGRPDGLRVLDIGCAVGYFTFRFALAGAHEVVAIEGDERVARVVEAVRQWQDLTNVQVLHGYLTPELLDDIPGSFDVVLLLNVHMWIHKQLGPQRTLDLLGQLAQRTRRLYFQTSHAESRGKYLVRELRDRHDVTDYLARVFTRVRLVRESDAHGGSRLMFCCENHDV